MARFQKGHKPLGNSVHGHKTSEETKRKISLAHKGMKYSLEARKRMSESRRGKPHPKVANMPKGERHWNWKGGITPINVQIRNSEEYRLWRKAVFTRDKYTCRFCGKIGGKLEADHIKPFSLYPELRFAIDNGRTLCKECHEKTDTYKNRKK
jgi:hypothetical protein